MSIVRDTLTADDLVEGPPLPRVAAPTARIPTAPPVDPATPLKRYYMAVAYSETGRAGPPSAVVEVALTPLPDAPEDLRVTYNAEAVTITLDTIGWPRRLPVRQALLPSASPLDDGPSVSKLGTLPPGPTRYNVYRRPSSPRTTAATDREDGGGVDVGALEFDAARWLHLHRPAYRVMASVAVIRCRRFADRPTGRRRASRRCLRASRQSTSFLQTRPTGVSPIAAEGAISLVWEANTDRDLQGYLVWRGEEGSETLTRITDEVVKETRYTDQNVSPGSVMCTP